MPLPGQTSSIVPYGTRLPPPTPGMRYVPVRPLGIIVSDDHLRRRVNRFFHWPMIILALAILPLLVIELLKKPEGWMDIAIKIGFAVIWFAFVVEFIIKILIAESRFEYAKRNWIDLVIILVPVLRPLRAAAVVRTTRVFKLRGVGLKGARYLFTIVIGLEATERLLDRWGISIKRQRKLPTEMTRHELIRELKQLRRLTDDWQAWHERHDEHVMTHGGACFVEPPPTLDEAEGEEPEEGV
ncbi:MAG: hypothetical protein HKO59_10060 [Phycisphaerales bacterium]|nr:hypothetical protein [Phycisphaerales bacterium]NNM26308.1 hypothetical protein [Phycisphaerales bacterium]